MAGAEATKTFQTVNSLVSQMVGQSPLTREDLKAVMIPETTIAIAIVNRPLQATNHQVSHKADQCPLTREDFKAVVIPLGTTLGRRPREDLKAILIPETNLTKT